MSEYGKSRAIYPTEHLGQPIMNFIEETFQRDGINCYYGVRRGDFTTSKSDMNIEDFKTIQEGKQLKRKVAKTGKEYFWKPISVDATDTIEVSMEAVGNLYCLDIDKAAETDGVKYGDYDFNELPDIFKECPYTKSRNKGNPHLFFRIDGIDAHKLKSQTNGGWKNASDNINFTDGEILTRMTWEYKDGEVFNYNGIIPTLNWGDVKNYLTPMEQNKWNMRCDMEYTPLATKKVHKKNNTVVVETEQHTQPKKKQKKEKDHEDEYLKTLDHADNISLDYIKEGKYSTWITLVWALRSVNDDDYIDIAYHLADRCGRDRKTYVDDYWTKYTEKGLNLGTFYHYSKMSNYKKYNEINYKYAPNMEQKLKDLIDIQTLDKTVNESDCATYFHNFYKTDLVLDRTANKLYIYYDNEWRAEDAKEPLILYNQISKYFDTFIKICWLKYGEEQYRVAQIENDKMRKAEQDTLKELHRAISCLTKKVKGISFNKNVGTFVKTKLAVCFNNKIFDVGVQDHYNINFKNGVYDMKEKIFRQRCYFDYITTWLDYDYIEPENIPKEATGFVDEFFKKLQPEKEQRDFQLAWLSYCLTGSVDKQLFKMNIGVASNGKSAEMSIHQKCFPIYIKKLNAETFDKNYTKRHKHIADLLNKPIRIAYIEELSQKKLDVDFLKDFVDAKQINCEIMFGTDETKAIQAKLQTNSNHTFNAKTDDGLKRRGLIQKYNSLFQKKEDWDGDVENHHYLRVDGIDKPFENVEYKNAYFHLLLQYTDKLTIPKSCVENFQEVCDDNDLFKIKFEETFDITGNVNDVVNWKEIARLVGGAKEGKEERNKISNDMERMKIKYDKEKKKDRVKGCYIGIKNIAELDEEPSGI